MKYTKLILSLVCVSLFTLHSCSDDDSNDKQDVSPEMSGTVKSFKDNIPDLSWNAQQAMGVYMLQPYAVNIVDNYKNVKYMADVTDNVLTASTDEIIYFPNSGNNVDLLMYAPWQDMVEDHVVSVNVRDQSNPAAIDLLYGFARGANKYNPSVNLEVKHALAHISFDIVVGESASEEDFKGLKARLVGFKTKASFNVLTGKLYSSDEEAPINMVISQDEEGYHANAIVLPISSISDDVILELYFPASNKTLLASFPESQKDLKASSKNILNVIVNDTQIEIKLVSVIIRDWENGNGTNGEDITVK